MDVGIVWNVFASILVLGTLIFVHELGHFLVAKWSGVGVLKFSIGFGPRLFGFRWGETFYQVSLIPLGGFVRMVGDMSDVITGDTTDTRTTGEGGEASESLLFDKENWFVEKSLSVRSAIVAAGPIANFITAIVLWTIAFSFYGYLSLDDSAEIGTLSAGSPADKAGLKIGDKVLYVGQTPIHKWQDLPTIVNASGGDPLRLQVERQGTLLELELIAKRQELDSLDGKVVRYMIGIGQKMNRNSASPGYAVLLGLEKTWDVIYFTIDGMVGMIVGRISADNLAGPLFIFSAAGDQAQKGAESLLHFMALLSVSLGVLNLLPIPVLDGGHLLVFFLEAIFGPISLRKKEVAQNIGAALLLCLMLYAVRNDLMRDTRTEDSAGDDGLEWSDRGGSNADAPN